MRLHKEQPEQTCYVRCQGACLDRPDRRSAAVLAEREQTVLRCVRRSNEVDEEVQTRVSDPRHGAARELRLAQHQRRRLHERSAPPGRLRLVLRPVDCASCRVETQDQNRRQGANAVSAALDCMQLHERRMFRRLEYLQWLLP